MFHKFCLDGLGAQGGQPPQALVAHRLLGGQGVDAELPGALAARYQLVGESQRIDALGKGAAIEVIQCVL